MSFFQTDNPWTETEVTGPQRAVKTLHDGMKAANAAAAALPGLRKPLEVFVEDLEAISVAYRRSDTLYRSNRALTVVHIPEIIKMIDGFMEIGPKGLKRADVAPIVADFKACLGAISEARAAITVGQSKPLQITSETLREQMVPAANTTIQDLKTTSGVLAQTMGATPVAEEVETPKPGFLSKARGALPGVGKLKGSLPDVSGLTEAAATRVEHGRKAAGLALSNTLQDGASLVTTPVTAGIKAAKISLARAAIGAGFEFGIWAILFPPIIPVAAGLAVLQASTHLPDTYAAVSKGLHEENDVQRKDRKRALDAALKGVKGQPPIIRIENDYLQIDIDTQGGQHEGVVLAGRNAGKSLHDIHRDELTLMRDTAPDAETRDIITAWRRRR